MKKVVIIILSVILLLSINSCGTSWNGDSKFGYIQLNWFHMNTAIYTNLWKKSKMMMN